MNGNYVADGGKVRREPTKTDRGYTMGFVLCEVCSHIDPDAAVVIAEAMNLHKATYPEKH